MAYTDDYNKLLNQIKGLMFRPSHNRPQTETPATLGIIGNETGSGTMQFDTSPTMTTPTLGTPTSVVLKNMTPSRNAIKHPLDTGASGTIQPKEILKDLTKLDASNIEAEVQATVKKARDARNATTHTGQFTMGGSSTAWITNAQGLFQWSLPQQQLLAQQQMSPWS